jgi:hypothetical protein
VDSAALTEYAADGHDELRQRKGETLVYVIVLLYRLFLTGDVVGRWRLRPVSFETGTKYSSLFANPTRGI